MWQLCSAVRFLWDGGYENVRCFEWHKQFKEGLENVEDDEVIVQDVAETMKML
jgi:hypothetical protein